MDEETARSRDGVSRLEGASQGFLFADISEQLHPRIGTCTEKLRESDMVGQVKFKVDVDGWFGAKRGHISHVTVFLHCSRHPRRDLQI